MLRCVLAPCLFLLLCATLPLRAQELPAEEVAAFEKARAEDPPGVRRRFLERFFRQPHADHRELCREALEANLKRWRWLERDRERLEKALDRNESDETLLGDYSYRLQELFELEAENRLLAQAWSRGMGTLPPAERDKDLDRVLKLLKRGHAEARHAHMLVVAEWDLPVVAIALGEALEKADDERTRLAAVEALTEVEVPESETALLANLDKASLIVRAAIYQGLGRVGGKAAVATLLERIESEETFTKGRLLRALRVLTGENYHDNVHLWRDWWARSGPSFRPPPYEARRVGLPQKKESQEGASFYGLRFDAESVVFLIDISDSMRELVTSRGATGSGPTKESKLDRAKRETLRTLDQLPSGTRVGIIAYGDTLEPYGKTLVVMTDTERHAMKAWVSTLRARGATNIHDALREALRWATPERKGPARPVDTIILLTDGHPTRGRLQDPLLLARDIARRNRTLGTILHCVGVGSDHARSMLEMLAQDSGGQYLGVR